MYLLDLFIYCISITWGECNDYGYYNICFDVLLMFSISECQSL